MSTEERSSRRLRVTSLAALGLILVLLAPAFPAQARGGKGRHVRAHHTKYEKHRAKHAHRSHRSHRVVAHHRHVASRHVSRSVRVVHARRTVVVPHRIEVHRAHVYRPYFHARVFHRGHGHFHAIYHFPVAGPHGVVHQPHAYCEGGLVVGASFPVGRGFVQIGLRF